MKTKPLFLAIALFGVLAVGCEDEPQVTDMCDTVTGMDVPTVKSIWATSVPDYSVKFTVLDSNWVHCDVHNESEYMLFFSDNCSYKYEKCDGDVNTVMITYQKDSTGIVTNCGGNNIYLIKKISPDSVVVIYGGAIPDYPCPLCVYDFYLHKIS